MLKFFKLFVVLVLVINTFSCKTKKIIIRPITDRVVFFDTVKRPNDTAIINLSFQNINNQEINIIKLTLSCGCLSTKSPLPLTIKPNSIEKIKIYYVPSINKDTGFVEKYAAVLSDADTAISNIIIRGFINK